MSYILDALKQSERRRNRQTPEAVLPEPAGAPPPKRQPLYRHRLFRLLMIIVLAMLIGLGLARFAARWLELPPVAEPVPQAQIPVIPDTSEDIAVTPPQPARQPIVISSNSPRILVEEPPAVSLNEPSAQREQTTQAAPTNANMPAGSVSQATPPEPVFDPGVPDIRELPASIRSRLPPLILSVHIYSPDPAARMANINGQMLREGQNVGSLGIERITPKGVVLSFQGNEFHLGSVGG
ncbi:general secretion pathway protein GspB [Oceanimonas baumannii]|uniref:general secretion pathway protein GspB n=1 Tax=Oceanimonas baumannii TaxID=129578 RepID=UPI001D18EA47|nr:general secretion pathway protein GspB [Oceanimonas baumannii]MCC4264521.1 general secretion pathway protein GspB [Oceanimonas baumannii]